jgi:hypothetical protein
VQGDGAGTTKKEGVADTVLSAYSEIADRKRTAEFMGGARVDRHYLAVGVADDHYGLGDGGQTVTPAYCSLPFATGWSDPTVGGLRVGDTHHHKRCKNYEYGPKSAACRNSIHRHYSLTLPEEVLEQSSGRMSK